MMYGHGSKEVETSAMDKKLDAEKGITEGSPEDKKADIMVGKKLAARKGTSKYFGKRMGKR